MKKQAILEDGAKKNAATATLCDHYVRLLSDPRYPTSPQLQGDAAKLRRRLIRSSQRLQNQLERAGVEKPGDLNAEVNSAIADALADTQSFRQSLTRKSDGAAANRTGDANRQAGAAGGAALGEAWELVELIQRIIAPDFWDSQGGPGVIRYFAMRRVLVVLATDEVHDDLKDLLIALR